MQKLWVRITPEWIFLHRTMKNAEYTVRYTYIIVRVKTIMFVLSDANLTSIKRNYPVAEFI